MTTYLCATCAVETSGPRTPDQVCPICADERQYLPPGGQRWRHLLATRQMEALAIEFPPAARGAGPARAAGRFLP